MVLELQFVRNTYTQVLGHEMKKALRMVRQYPENRFDERHDACGHTARELAELSVEHLRRIAAIASGEPEAPGPDGPRLRGAILLDLETSFLGTRSSLASLPRGCWSEVIAAPPGLASWTQARRGELLWLALREMGQHHRHFANHMKLECQGGPHDDGGRRANTPERSIDHPVAVGA